MNLTHEATKEIVKSIESYINVSVIKENIVFAVRASIGQTEKAFRIGNDLREGYWKPTLSNDLTYSLTPLPGFCSENFPYVVGLNGQRDELMLVNLKHEIIVPLARIKKRQNYDCITDI